MDDILQWPHIDTEIIFAYILIDCDLEYVGWYKDQKPAHTLIVSLLTPFLLTILLVVEIKSFYILKLRLLLQFQIKKKVDVGAKRTIRDTYNLVQLYDWYKPKL